ncbi:hypothetical protein [Niabella aurantiaca]|uniref:hypothetical protein n=1 Tax=Niabella aurantiaca TaxID=379900 RepID=UPI00037DFD7B|nr:hypothetical protein [Niabella aurantiaca]
MFNFLFNKKGNNPIDTETEKWMNQAFSWLIKQFGESDLKSKDVLTPDQKYFPIRYDGTMSSLQATAVIVASQMGIDVKEINLQVYENNIHELGRSLWTNVEKEQSEALSQGLYFDKNESGYYDILVEKSNLDDPENLVATLAHEFSHIKILGEHRLELNDESLTDLATVVFGLGIFNANAAFKEIKSIDGYGYKTAGYLTQKEWGYALALYAIFRGESSPEWVQYLNKNIKSDFEKSILWLMLY